MIDSLLAEIGIEGGSLSKMQGLIREARDLEGIRKDVAARDAAARGDAKAGGSDATPASAPKPRRGGGGKA